MLCQMCMYTQVCMGKNLFLHLYINTHLFNRNDDERATSSTLGDNGQVFGVDRTEVRVVGILGDLYAFVTLLLLERAPKHMPELGNS